MNTTSVRQAKQPEPAKPATPLWRNALWMAWSGTINIANSVVLWMALARWRTPDEVGQFATVMSLYTLFITICGLGLTPYLTSELARRRERRRFTASAALLITAASVVCALLLGLTGQFTETTSSARLALWILSLAVIPSGWLSLGEAIFTAVGQARVIALATTTENLLRTLLPLALLYRGASLPLVCASFVFVRVAACAVYLFKLEREFKLSLNATSWPERTSLQTIARAVPAFAGVTVLASLHWQLGTVLAGKLGNTTAAAEFGIAARFLVPAMVLLWSYVSVIQPTASRLAEQSQVELSAFLQRCLRFVLALALPVALGGCWLGRPLLTLLFGAQYSNAALTLALLGASLVPFAVVMIVSRGLIALRQQRFDVLANLCAVLVNLLSNVLFIPRYGAAGAALAQLLSLTTMAGVELYGAAQVNLQINLRGALWAYRWPLAVLFDVLLLTAPWGFWWALTLGSASYLLTLFFVRRQLFTEPSQTAATEPSAFNSANPAPRILMLGAHPTKTLGGISTLIGDILRSPLTTEFEFKHIVSQMDEARRWGKLLLMLQALGQFSWTLLAWRPALVYIHVGGNASLYRKAVFITLARCGGWRVVSHIHAGNFAPYFAQQSVLGQQFILRGLGLSHKFIAVSQEMATWLAQRWPHCEVSVIPNGVRLEEFAVERPAAASVKVPRLLFVGKMGFLKGEGDLLRALQQMQAAQPRDFRLDMLGQRSADIAAIVAASGLAAHLDQLGPVALHERRDYFQRADIFVLPTYAEGMPIAVIEAMAAGLPVISTPVGGTPELVTDGCEGFLVTPGDIPALAQRLAQLLDDASLRQQMSVQAVARASRYDLKFVLAQLGNELRQQTALLNLPPMQAIEKARTET